MATLDNEVTRNQCDAVWEYMNKKRRGKPQGITQVEAYEKLGCFRLSGRIFDLKERGKPSTRVWEEGRNGKRWARYFPAKAA